jgi:hypothetical protein
VHERVHITGFRVGVHNRLSKDAKLGLKSKFRVKREVLLNRTGPATIRAVIVNHEIVFH